MIYSEQQGMRCKAPAASSASTASGGQRSSAPLMEAGNHKNLLAPNYVHAPYIEIEAKAKEEAIRKLRAWQAEVKQAI